METCNVSKDVSPPLVFVAPTDGLHEELPATGLDESTSEESISSVTGGDVLSSNVSPCVNS